MSDQASQLRNLVKEKTDDKRIFAITSGKGGVGKSNIAVNLAVAFQLAGKNVLLVDADIGMANVNVLLGRVTSRSLVELRHPRVKLWDVVEETELGLKFVSGVAGLDTMLNTSDKDLAAIRKKITAPNNFVDIIIIDTGASLNKFVIEFMTAAREVLLVTTSEPTALADAYEVVKAYEKYGDRKDIKLIVNRVREIKEWRETADKLNQTTQNFLNMDVQPLGYLYEDRAVHDAVLRQEPFLIRTPNSPASRCMKALAYALLNNVQMAEISKGWRNWFSFFN